MKIQRNNINLTYFETNILLKMMNKKSYKTQKSGASRANVGSATPVANAGG